MFERKIKKIEKKISMTFKARSAEFGNSDDTKYWILNKKLNKLRALLNKYFAVKAQVNAFGVVSKAPSKYGKVRFETLPEKQAARIDRIWLDGGWIYRIKNGPFGALKDIVASLD